MKVFISWSGPLSHEVALALRHWLPMVRQSIEPYVSSEDVEKGVRWILDLSTELEDTDFGIICVTKDNYRAPWLNFEAGALSKSVQSSRVTPFLVDLRPADLSGPLSQLQATTMAQDDIVKLVKTLNQASSTPLDDSRLEEIVEVWWPQLEDKLRHIVSRKPSPTQEPERDVRGILEEILGIVRSIRRSESLQPVQTGLSATGGVDEGSEQQHGSLAAMELLALALRHLGIPDEEFFVRLSTPSRVSIYAPPGLSQEAKLKILEFGQVLGFKDVDIQPVAASPEYRGEGA